MKEAVIYARGSSNEQGQERFSLEAQASFVREYALRNTQVINTRVDVDAAKRLRKNSKREKREKASRGIYPGCVPFGYRDCSADGTIEVDPVESLIVTWIFELCAAGNPCAEPIAKAILDNFDIRVSEENIDVILHDWFYFGVFEWEKHWYSGIHPIFLRPGVFYKAHSILHECTPGADPNLAVAQADRCRTEIMPKESDTNGPIGFQRCAIYARCASIETGANPIPSILRQQLSCRAAATKNGWIVLENYIYADLGRSGNTGRPALDALLAAARANPRPFDHLLVEEGSRLARNLSILVKILAELNGLGIKVHLASTGCELGESTIGLSLSALASFNDPPMETLERAVTSKSKSR
jgi:DNA invertase Pin-like site-specific DNA recombinase